MLLVGPTGTGKSAYIQNYLMNKIDRDTIESAFITFTVMITANQTQELLISKVCYVQHLEDPFLFLENFPSLLISRY